MNSLRHPSVVAIIGLAQLCGACAGGPVQGVLIPVAESAGGASRVPLLAVTTRKRSTADVGEMFSGERAEETSYVAITVSIPPDANRQIGQVQWPESVPGDPGRHFVTVSANHLDRRAFKVALSAAAKQSRLRRVLVFVHGFNNRFDEAVYRFAQIVHDSKSPATPVLFTWPSRGDVKLSSYAYDRESANYSRDALEDLLDVLARDPSVAEINIVAHSMGNWLTLEALRGRAIRAAGLADRSGRIPDKVAAADKVKNAFLVAPDVDVDVFRTQIRRMGSFRPHFLLFVSQDDKALGLSKIIMGGMQRLGDIDPAQEPYRSELAQDRVVVFDLTKIKAAGSNAHSRAFDDITTVVNMIRERAQDIASTNITMAQVTSDQQSAIRNSCQSDFSSKCSGVTPGGRDALTCLQKNVASLAPACKTAVSATIPAAAPPQAAPAPAAPATAAAWARP